MKKKTDLWIAIFVFGFFAIIVVDATEGSVFWGGLGVVLLAITSAVIAMKYGKEEDGSSNFEQPEG